MRTATIRIPTPLRALTGGAGEVAVSAATVGEALGELERLHPGILARVLDERGRIRGFVNVYVGETNVKSLDGLETALNGASVISIVPAVAGGAR
jgi:molybdopterin synthase sulfur carrier subunit